MVTGIRNSLSQAMDIKRNSAGVVDAISAEDIGKFPDSNLAESLQRVTGISIERRDGEGAQVTARGFGPQFNMVTLNGRQVPGADAFGASGQVAIGGVDGGTRAFNFAQLAAEAISGIEVYKTSQAHVPSGGIGATILDACDETGAGLLIMGAYEHSKFSEDLLGGVTRDILEKAQLPVLMSH